MAAPGSDGRKRSRWDAARLAAIVAIVLLAAFVGWLLFGRDDCSAELLINGRKLDYGAAIEQLDLKASASPTAQAVVSERLQAFMSLSANLCRDREAGRISEQLYGQRQQYIADWFMNVEQAASSGALKKVGPGQSGQLADSMTGASAAPQKLAEVSVTNADGAILPDGAIVRDGDRIRIAVKLAQPRYLHIIGVGSSGLAYRIFPSAQSPVTNPVSGTVEIPAQEGRYFRVSGSLGQEELHFFLLEKPDPQIEALGEIGGQARDMARQVREIVQLRDLFTEPPPKVAAAAPAPVDVKSRFGSAAITLRYRHAS
jgi:hypothetical protein